MKQWILSAAALTGLALPAAAQVRPTGPIPATPEEHAVRPLLREATEADRRGDHDAAIVAAEKALAQLPEPSKFRAWVNCAYGVRMLGRDMAKARPAIEECHTLLPDQPTAKMAYSQLLIRDGKQAEGYRMLAEAVRSDPRWMQKCDTSTTGSIRTQLRVLSYDRALDDVRMELIEALTSTACGSEDPAFYSGLMRDVIARRLARGETDRARASLSAVIDPDDMLKMLVDRRYAALWPDIEQMTAGTLEPQRVAFVHKVRQNYLAAPSLASATRLAYALGVTGGRNEAIMLLARSLANPALSMPERFEDSTAATRLADMRNEAGETREAVMTAPLRALLAGGSPQSYPGLWNVVPNLAQWLITYDRPGEALAVLDRYVPHAKGLDSPAAHGFFVALRGCARMRGGDTGGQKLLDEVLRDFAGNAAAVKIAVTCGADREALRTTILAQMEDEQARSGLLIDMLRIRLFGKNGRAGNSPEYVALASLLNDPAVAARFDALARDPGPGYRAALRRWRKP